MRLRNITGSREVIAESPYVVPEDTLESCPGTWHEIFGNDHPIHIEIGMGKGRFLHTLAKSNPQINYVGIEKYSSVLLRAIQKMEEDELPNLKFIRMDARRYRQGIREGRGRPDLSELLRSLAEGPPCQETPALQTVSGTL